MGEDLGGTGPAHRLGLAPSGPVFASVLRSPLVDAAAAARSVACDEFEPFGPESRPGGRVVDLFSYRISVHRPPSEEDDMAAYVRDLDSALRSAGEDATCLVVASDASVPRDRSFQAAVATLVYAGGVQV